MSVTQKSPRRAAPSAAAKDDSQLRQKEMIAAHFARLARAGERGDNAPPPTLGQHTQAVLSGDLGLSGEAISRLRASGVVK